MQEELEEIPPASSVERHSEVEAGWRMYKTVSE